MRILLKNKISFFPIGPFLGPFLLQGLFSWKVLRFSLVALQTCYVKCEVSSALQRKRSAILLSPATNLLSVRFHIVDKYLHSLVIWTSFQISRGFLLSDWNLEWFAGPSKMFPRTCDVRHAGNLVHYFYTELGQVKKKWRSFLFLCRSLQACNSFLFSFFLFAG